jgi:hypothetical protein
MTGSFKRAGARARVLATFIAVGAVVQATTTAHWTWLLVSLAVLVTIQLRYQFQAVGLALALMFGAWPAAVAAVLSAAVEAVWQLILRFGRIPPVFDEPALSALVADVPESITRSATSVVDTLALLEAAITQDPGRWNSAARGVCADVNGEGGFIANTRWTVVAAEAILVARQHPDELAVLDIHALAAAAALLPNSRARAAIANLGADQALPLRVLGLSQSDMAKMLAGAAKRPGGGLITTRVDLDLRGRPGRSSLLDDAGWAAITGRNPNGTRER